MSDSTPGTLPLDSAVEALGTSVPRALTEADRALPKLGDMPTRIPPGRGLDGQSAGELQIVLNEAGGENPFVPHPASAATPQVGGTSDDYYGAFSLEKFCNVGSLTYTHEDASGWLDYPTQFNRANFWYQDGGVQPWAYYQQYDNWQDTYGMDAVNAVYHSGHGGMDSNGVFSAPVGADWGGLGCTVRSDQMRLGDEQVNYIFWSTCFSLRVLGGHSPIRTWEAANLGFRMLFGFETTSIDSPNYGKFFWEEWKKNKSFSTAWLDASWRISHNQAPSVVACGANQTEATNRLNNERLFYWDHVSHNWWQWRWYYAASGINAQTAPRQANLLLPREFRIAQLMQPAINARSVRNIIDRLGLDIPLPTTVSAARDGAFSLVAGDRRIAFALDGSFSAQLARPNLDNREAIPVAQAASIAREALSRYGLDREAELVFDRARHAMSAGGTTEGSGQMVEPTVTETTLSFKQVVGGLPVITPGSGEVSVSIDNDGTITSVQSSVRILDRLIERPRRTATPPGEGTAPGRPRATDPAGYEQLLSEAWSKQLTRLLAGGRAPLQYTTVPGSTEIGYAIRGNDAVVVVQREIEVDFGGGYLKRYQIEAPLFE